MAYPGYVCFFYFFLQNKLNKNLYDNHNMILTEVSSHSLASREKKQPSPQTGFPSTPNDHSGRGILTTQVSVQGFCGLLVHCGLKLT